MVAMMVIFPCSRRRAASGARRSVVSLAQTMGCFVGADSLVSGDGEVGG